MLLASDMNKNPKKEGGSEDMNDDVAGTKKVEAEVKQPERTKYETPPPTNQQSATTNKVNPFSPILWVTLIRETIWCYNLKEDRLPPQSTLEIPNYNHEIARTEQHFRWAAFLAIGIYGTLLTFAYTAGADSEEVLSSTERSAAFLGMVCLGVTVVLQLLPILFRLPSGGGVSGIIFAAIVVQLIALTTSALIAFGEKPPILIDSVTGARVHLLRWAEWTPVAFLMTFLVEAADAPDKRYKLVPAYVSAFTQGLSTIAGFVFPFCTMTTSWNSTLAISFCFYFYIIFRLRCKHARFGKMPTGKRLDQLEIYHRAVISLHLHATCAVGWTFLVTMFMTFSVFGPLFAPVGSWLRHPAAPMISEAFVDCVLKILYMSYIVEMHQKVFDEGVRAKRRLEELRQMMWDHSSDVMAISVESLSGTVTTMVSPTFVKMLRQGKVTTESLEKEMKSSSIGDKGMTFEISKADLKSFLDGGNGICMPQVQPKLHNFRIDDMTATAGKKKVKFKEDAIGPDEMQALAELMARSWYCQNRDSLLTHDLVYRESASKLGNIKCEARVTKLEESALFVVVRDISERFRRFEAEKLAVSEMTARRKDSEANRFTRHEVKNGLLAAIGLCESMNESVTANLTPEVLTTIEAALGTEHAAEMNKLFSVQDTITTLVKEMDTALQEVLDTILAEAMARDVVHENYSPQLEKMNLAQLLRSLTRHTEGKSDRFPVKTSPDPFPTLMCDRQLLKCIHRNAVSNASKYGERGGLVSTNLFYDEAKETMHLKVVNKPGTKHEQLLRLGEEGISDVFAQGVRLHPSLEGGEKQTAVARQSSGDGAWIMRKCAKTLGGDCGIEFQDEQTVFSMSCPATSVDRIKLEESQDGKAPGFKFPKKTWGIAIDDSKIQRKLLKRMLTLAGIDEKRIIILGETAEEIRTFDDFVIDKVDNHPNDHFLLVVDENLDIDMDDLHVNQTTISGSMLIQNIRHRVLAEQERQMLAVVRSANDSSHDIAIYNSRAHGFMPKAPFKKESVLEVLAPLWENRFSVIENLRLDWDTMSWGSSGNDSFSGTSDSEPMQDESEGFVDLIQGHVSALDKLIRDEENVDSRWHEIREKMHILKGDLSSLNFPSSESSPIIEEITSMRVKNAPVDLARRWQVMRQLVLQLSANSREGLVE